MVDNFRESYTFEWFVCLLHWSNVICVLW
jgi:hypothetical protein